MYDAAVNTFHGKKVGVDWGVGDLSPDKVEDARNKWNNAGYRVEGDMNTVAIDVYPPNSRDGDGQKLVAVYRRH